MKNQTPLFFLLRMTNAPVATAQTANETIRPVSEELVWEMALGAQLSPGWGTMFGPPGVAAY